MEKQKLSFFQIYLIIEIENIKRIHRYHPLVSKEQYSKSTLVNVTEGYFGGSFPKVVSFLVNENKLSVQDLELLLNQLKSEK